MLHVLSLSWPAEQQPVQAEHLAFAVVFGKNFDFSEEEVNPVKLDFLCVCAFVFLFILLC